MGEGAPVKLKWLCRTNPFHFQRHSFFPTAARLIHRFHPSRSLCLTFSLRVCAVTNLPSPLSIQGAVTHVSFLPPPPPPFHSHIEQTREVLR